MEDSRKKVQDEIKSSIDSLLIYASQVSYSEDHPLRIIQAAKSIIGINLLNPPKIILKWIEEYLKKYEPSFNIPKLSSNNELEVISYDYLDSLITDGDIKKSHEYLNILLQSASPISIAEYLFEISFRESSHCVMFIWSALKSIQFLGDQKGYPILYHCVSNIIDSRISCHIDEFSAVELNYHSDQIRKFNLIRKSKIECRLDAYLGKVNKPSRKPITFSLPDDLKKHLLNDGLDGFHLFLSDINTKDLSDTLVLKMDALRSYMRFSDLPIEQVLNTGVNFD